MDMYSPVCLAKCVKNEKEVLGMVEANNKDAVALCRYFQWLEQNVIWKFHAIFLCVVDRKKNQGYFFLWVRYGGAMENFHPRAENP